MEKISIIVPIYKTARFLDKCIQSILAQTYIHYEVILVLDGFDQECYDICKKYADNDQRISIFDIPHQGVSAARNYGLKVMKGDYVAFIDSDDWIHRRYLETLIRDIIYCMADVACCGYDSKQRCFESDVNTVCVGGKESINFCRIRRANSLFYGTAVWNKLFRVSALQDTDVFDESFSFGEDTKFLFPIMLRAERVAFGSEVRYYHQGNRTKEKREYATYMNFLKYYTWEKGFFTDNELDNELIQEVKSTIDFLCVLEQIQRYIQEKRYVSEFIVSKWTLVKKHISNKKNITFLGRMKLIVVMYMIRLGVNPRIVSLIYNLHD